MFAKFVSSLQAIQKRFESFLNRKTMDSELERMINKYLLKKFSQRFRFIGIIAIALFSCIGLAAKLQVTELDDDLSLRVKVFPVLGALILALSEKIRRQDSFNSMYMLLLLPILVVFITEAMMAAPIYTKMFGFSSINLIINFLLKFSNINKREKMGVVIVANLYFANRLRLHSLTTDEPI